MELCVMTDARLAASVNRYFKRKMGLKGGISNSKDNGAEFW